MKQTIIFVAAMLMAFAGTAQHNVARRQAAPVRGAQSVSAVERTAHWKAIGDTIREFPWTEDFETETAVGFTFADNDNDGHGWNYSNDGRIVAHSGMGVMWSASWFENVALTPDNWMILPAFEIPSDGEGYNLSWWVRGQDPDYPDEYYSVYINTTGRSVSDFTATTPVYNDISSDDWVKMTIDLSDYAGQVIFIGFRHWQSTDVFYLNIDDIRVGGLEPPIISINGPSNVELGTEVEYTAMGATTIAWTLDGTVLTSTDNQITIEYETAGLHSLIAAATNAAGTGYDTLEVNVFDCSQPITDLPWNEGFEGSTDCWHLFTADNESAGFTFYESDEYAHNSMVSLFGSYSDDVDVDQWAISPRIELPSDANDLVMKYYVRLFEWEGVQSHYQILLSTEADANPTYFTTILKDETGASTDYEARTIDLADYAGQTIRIAIRNITAMGGDVVLFDDLYIGERPVPDLTLTGAEIVRVDEPYTFTASSDANNFTWAVDGTPVNNTGTTLTHTFTTAGAHTVTVSVSNAAGSNQVTLDVTAITCEVQGLPFRPNLASDINLCWDMQGWDTVTLEDEVYFYSMSNYMGWIDLNPDNWMVTPKMMMPQGGNYEVAWKVKPYYAELPSDHYGVYLIQDGDTTLLYQETLTANISGMSTRSVAITSAREGEFKIGFRHYETTGGYIILLNGVEVVAAGTTTGIESADQPVVALYPNPTSEQLTIEANGIEQVELIDLSGRIVKRMAHGGLVNIADLPSGIYMVRVVTSEGVSIQKVIKE